MGIRLSKHGFPNIQPLLLFAAWIMLAGFDLEPSLVPSGQIISGGPPKDGIPALTNPKIESAASANEWLRPWDRILAVSVNGRHRAYPVRILNWHEIVNDRIDGKAFVVTYCPLCGSGVVFDTQETFGVSGLLYQSDVLLYDKKTESLWSQLMAQAVTGPRIGERLKTLPVTLSTWEAWRKQHPKGSVLSRRTGYRRDYSRDPYQNYDLTDEIFFPVGHSDDRLHAKAWVIALASGGKARAWHVDAVARAGELRENWNGRDIIVRYNKEADSVKTLDAASGDVLPATTLYWFAWAAFHPDTELYLTTED
jgi:hypothetical protein